MLQFGLLCVLIAGASAGYSSSGAGASSTSSGLYNNIDSSSANYGSKYPYGNAFTGFAGGAVGAGGPNFPVYAPFQFAPLAGVPNPYDFNLALNQYFQSLQQNFASGAATHTYAEPGSNVYASASFQGPSVGYQQNHVDSNDLYAQQFAQQAALQQAILHQASLGGGGYGGGGAQYAGSSASYGPGGYHQSAQIYPGNPGSPNIDTRFGSDGGTVTYTSGGGPGVHGVSTSSFVSSSDINGQKTGHRESVTSVNNNGKVTTYRVRN